MLCVYLEKFYQNVLKNLFNSKKEIENVIQVEYLKNIKNIKRERFETKKNSD